MKMKPLLMPPMMCFPHLKKIWITWTYLKVTEQKVSREARTWRYTKKKMLITYPSMESYKQDSYVLWYHMFLHPPPPISYVFLVLMHYNFLSFESFCSYRVADKFKGFGLPVIVFLFYWLWWRSKSIERKFKDVFSCLCRRLYNTSSVLVLKCMSTSNLYCPFFFLLQY